MLHREDRVLLESLSYDPSAEPAFDPLRYCLVWADERPVGLTPSGYELLGDLWIVRGFIHRKLDEGRWGLDPAHFRSVWSYAQDTHLAWPGFRRIELSPEERAYLSESMSDPEPF